jgi:hypothetical protein
VLEPVALLVCDKYIPTKRERSTVACDTPERPAIRPTRLRSQFNISGQIKPGLIRERNAEYESPAPGHDSVQRQAPRLGESPMLWVG